MIKMVNDYNRKYCDVCAKETLHNNNTCISCVNKKQYLKNRTSEIKRCTKRYYEHMKDPSRIYTQKVQTAKRKNHIVLLTREEFIAWFNETPYVCDYCGRTAEQWREQSTKHKGHINLTIDRIDNDKEYELGNICWACRDCNSYKRDKKVEDFKING